MARSMGGGGLSSGGGGRSMGGGGHSTRSFSGSGRSRVSTGGSSTRRVGGSSSYSSHSHTSYNRPSSSYHYSSGYHHHHCPPPVHYHSRPRYYSGGPTHYSGGSGCGCGTFLIMLLILWALSSLLNFADIKTSERPTSSTTTKKLNKDKYDGAVCTKHGYYIDDSDPSMGGFIDRSNESTLVSGFKEFYKKTGVYPFLYIVESIPDGYNNARDYSEYIYEKLFTEGDKVIEGNLLILFVADEQNGEGDYYLTGGLNIGATIDDAATDIICAEINSRWDTGNLGNIMGNGLKDASKSIMAKSNAKTFGMTAIIGLVVIIIILIIFKWWKAAKAQKNKEQEDLERVLNTPLQTFGSSSMDDLTNKYK